MSKSIQDLAGRLLHIPLESLTERERRVLQRFVERRHVSRNINREFSEQLTLGQRVADRVAALGGSWQFIGAFGAVLAAWILLNIVLLARRGTAFDPYPFILLNLLLSMLAAVQAPVILMSQNRQAAKDRMDAAHDYEVNLKAELEILTLHEKVDGLRDQQWAGLLKLQEEQIALLRQLLGTRPGNDDGGTYSGGAA
jgi:uncharacterized membrane protein